MKLEEIENRYRSIVSHMDAAREDSPEALFTREYFLSLLAVTKAAKIRFSPGSYESLEERERDVIKALEDLEKD